MKLPKSILYYSVPYEGEESHAKKRAKTALALRELLAAPHGKGERRLLPSLLALEELSAASPERVTAFSLARERGRMDAGLFYIDAGDCLGDGELLLRSLLMADPKPSEYPLPLTCSAPAVLPQLLFHFGCTNLCLLGEKTNIKAPVCRENTQTAYLWRSPDGSECRLTVPKDDRAVPSECGEVGFRRAVFAASSEEEEFFGAVSVDRLNAWEEFAPENRRAADLLLGVLEPLTALLGATGARVCPPAVINRLTGDLLKNLSITDSIALAPYVCAHRLDRVRALTEEAEGYIAAVMECTLPRTKRGEEFAVISVFSPYDRKTDVQFACTLTLPSDRPFRLVDASGNELFYTVRERKSLSGEQSICHLTVLYPESAPLSISRIFAVWGNPCVAKTTKPTEKPRIENENFLCEADGGRLKITCKKTRRVLQNPFFFEDQGDRGTSAFLPAQEGSLLFFPEEWTRTGDGLSEELSADCALDLPADYDTNNWERTAETCTVPCRITLRLEKGSDLLGVTVRFRDRAHRHRLRLAVRTEMMDGTVFCDAPFSLTPLDGGETDVPGVLAVERDGETLALLTDTRRAVARVNDTFYVTLAHTADYRGCTQKDGEETEVRLAIFGGRDVSAASLFDASRRFRLSPVAASVTFRETAVCDEGFSASLCHRPLLACDTPEVFITGAKCRADGSAVLHLLNPTDRELPVRLTADRAISLTSLAEREELRLTEGGSVGLTVAPHQIIALLLYAFH